MEAVERGCRKTPTDLASMAGREQVGIGMARYRHSDMSPRLLPVDLQTQLVPGPFAHALHPAR